MTLEDFKSIIETQIVPVLEKQNQYGSRKKEMIEYYPGYLRNAKQAEQARVHADAYFPANLFRKIAPNQSDDDFEYLKSTYQCETNDVFLDFSNTVKRGLINGAIEWPKSESDEKNDLKEFIKTEVPQFNSLYEFVKSMADQKLVDANAVLGIHFKPRSIDEDGNIEGGILPYPTIYGCQRVVHIGDDGEFIVERYEKSMVVNGNDKTLDGYRYLGFSKEAYFYANQYGVRNEFKFEFDEYPHELGFNPAMRLMGTPMIIGDKLHFKSPFSNAVPKLNLAVLDSANLLVIKRKVTYPTRAFVAQKCRNQKNGSPCIEGVINWKDGDRSHSETCGSCKGTGMVGIFGPNSEIHINNEDNPEGGQLKASDAMAYISPSVDIPKFLREEIDRFINSAKEVLHLKAEPRTQGNITATEKNIDLKSTEAFIKPISDQIWHLYAFMIETIGILLLGKDAYETVKPTIIPAKEFDIITTDDYIIQLAEAKKNGLPSFVISSIIYNMMMSMNYGDTEGMKIFELIQASDRFWTASPDQVALALSRNTAQRWEVVLHDSALPIVIEAIETYRPRQGAPRFFDLEMGDQIQIIQDLAKSKVPNNGTDDLPPPAEI